MTERSKVMFAYVYQITQLMDDRMTYVKEARENNLGGGPVWILETMWKTEEWFEKAKKEAEKYGII